MPPGLLPSLKNLLQRTLCTTCTVLQGCDKVSTEKLPLSREHPLHTQAKARLINRGRPGGAGRGRLKVGQAAKAECAKFAIQHSCLGVLQLPSISTGILQGLMSFCTGCYYAVLKGSIASAVGTLQLRRPVSFKASLLLPRIDGRISSRSLRNIQLGKVSRAFVWQPHRHMQTGSPGCITQFDGLKI